MSSTLTPPRPRPAVPPPGAPAATPTIPAAVAPDALAGDALRAARATLAAHVAAHLGEHHLTNMARRHALRRQEATRIGLAGLLDDPWEAQTLADLDTLFRVLGVELPALDPVRREPTRPEPTRPEPTRPEPAAGVTGDGTERPLPGGSGA